MRTRASSTGGTSVTADVRGATIRTPFGRDLFVACSLNGIVESRFVARAPGAPARRPRTDGLLRDVLSALDLYFARKSTSFAFPLVLEGTELQVDAWNAVATVPFGARVSYAEVARAIGRPNAHRGVATALAKTPLALFIPAHRVVGADGRVRGATPGSMRRRLLAFEARPSRETKQVAIVRYPDS